MNEKMILHIILTFFIIVTGLIILDTTRALDTSGWSFLGSSIAVSVVPWAGLIFIVVGVALEAFFIIEEFEGK